jgi:hypothetical protein
MLALAFCRPLLAATPLARVEKILGAVARRKRLAIIIPGLAMVLLRLAILPLMAIPLPTFPPDFSFLIAAETFASGRLTNPTPPMWVHFESIHITMHPSYMSMYFPAHGLVMAAGEIFFGHPWFGVLLAGALFCSVLCWALQAWLPPNWAFFGSMLAVIRIGLFSYWINTYSGGGMVAALGGALVLGAAPRCMRSMQQREGALLGIGMAVLLMSRPYEGMLLCLPVTFVLVRKLLGENKLGARLLLRSAALPLGLVVAAGSWMAYYDYRVFGHPTTLPYTIDRNTYAIAPYYVWQHARPEPQYHHAALRNFYHENELGNYEAIHKPFGLIFVTVAKVVLTFAFFAGVVLLVPLLMLEQVIKDRRVRLLLVCVLTLIPGMLIEIFLIPHYLAPFTTAFYGIGLQCMRHLRVWKPGGRPVGLAMVRGCVTVCLAMVPVRLAAAPLHIVTGAWPNPNWSGMGFGPDSHGTEREAILDTLARAPGRHLVLVRYLPNHEPINEWVYNAPDIDHAKVIWARDMDAANNAELIRYYHDRNVWLVQPDLETGKLTPYPGLERNADSAQTSNAAVEMKPFSH